MLEWFYRLSSFSGGMTSVLQRERVRRSRLLSTVVLVLMLFIFLVMPATFFIPNKNTLHVCLAVLVICCIVLIFNRAGKIMAGGWIIVISCEIGLIVVIGTTSPFDTLNLPLYDIMVIGEILAVSLLPPRSVFFVAFLNSLVISWSVFFEVHTKTFAHILESQQYNLLIRPISLQIVISLVTYVFVTSINQAIRQSAYAHALASLEHNLAMHAQKETQLQKNLEIALINLHGNMIDLSEGRLPQTSIEQIEKRLWPLQATLEQIQTRLENTVQRAEWAEDSISRIIQIKDNLPLLKVLLDEMEKGYNSYESK